MCYLGLFLGIWLTTAMQVFVVLGSVIAFKGVIGACYGAKLPLWDDLFPPKMQTGEEPAETPPAE